MGRIVLAFKTFFSILGNKDFANQVDSLGRQPAIPVQPPVEAPVAPTPPTKKALPPELQNPAVTLLETLQREARLIDFIQEPLEGYSDTQIGAAVREVHRGCASVFERCFGLAPVIDQPDGSAVTIEQPFSPAMYRLLGSTHDKTTISGSLTHPGWQVTRCDLPRFHGEATVANIVAPAEIEVR